MGKGLKNQQMKEEKFEKDSIEDLLAKISHKEVAERTFKMDDGFIMITRYLRDKGVTDPFEGATDDNPRFKLTDKKKRIKVGDTLWYHSVPVLVLEVKDQGCEFGYFKDSIGFYRAFDSADFPKFENI